MHDLRRRRLALFARVLVAALIIIGARFLLIRYQGTILNSGLGCPLYHFTGYYCAGCGGTRAFFAFLKGDLAGSWRMNPVFLSGLACGLLYLAAYWWQRLATGRFALPFRLRFSVWTGWCLLGLLFMFMILRNIPAPPFNQLAPH